MTVLAAMRWQWRVEEDGCIPVVDRGAFIGACAEYLRQGILSGQWVCWLALMDGRIVSHICVRRIRKVPKPDRLRDEYGSVTNVYTRPRYRGRGIGSSLLRRVKSWAVEKDLEELIVWPAERSVIFYERAGFVSDNEIMECVTRVSAAASE
jgi:GNAT superfamily N-acetyltransferase